MSYAASVTAGSGTATLASHNFPTSSPPIGRYLGRNTNFGGNTVGGNSVAIEYPSNFFRGRPLAVAPRVRSGRLAVDMVALTSDVGVQFISHFATNDSVNDINASTTFLNRTFLAAIHRQGDDARQVELDNRYSG